MTELDSPPTVAGGTLNELFASCVRRFAGATALIHGDVRFTFAEIDAMSDHYAAALERAGIGPGDIVPVVMGRTPEMVALLLAVLKRGAAYSAMDPLWPGARQAALIARLRPRLVIAAAEGPWPEPTWVPPPYDPAGPRRTPSPVTVSPEDRCVVIFTSGTTGQPKGVVIPHRSLARLFDNYDFWMALGPGVTIPQVSALSWDGFVVDGWGPLLTGGTTVLVDQPVLTPAALSELTGRYGVNAIDLVTSLFNLLVDEGLDSFAGLHTVSIGAEKASPAHLRRFLERYPDTRVINGYGPAECGVLATAHDVRLADCDAAGGIPIGKALPHTAIYILDGARPCEDGQVGEICVAGDALALGYLDDDELTASKFTQTSIDGAPLRVYRTGDLGHWRSDRALCFDGRTDRQLKVHAYRVEPGEIEQAAAAVAGVATAAVVPLRRDGIVDAVALFYTSPRSQVTEAALRAELSGTLPGYLVPRLIRRIDRFPLLPNGKLDYLMLEMIISAAEPGAQAPQGQHGGTLNELFASCVRRFADATALIHGDVRFTFAEIDAMSDHYAAALERAGIGPGDIVPVVMGRTPEMVALLLAVLKRGAAYSAMDPLWPGAHQAALISRLRPRLVIAAAEGPWPEPTWVPPRYDPAGPGHTPSPVTVSPEDRCVVIFTSGTTGEPKGVVIPHRSLARLFDNYDFWMALGPGVTIPQVSALSWDGFVVDGWGPLLTGGTTVLVDQPVLTPAALSELTGRYGVNAVYLVTSLFNLLVDEGLDSFAGLHTVAIAGEQASPAHLRRFLERYPDTRVINGYGPIECGVLATAHDVRLADCDAAGGIPIGKALPHTAIYVLDGEICVAGDALALGYLDDDELTASKFTQLSKDGAPLRVYRTGDLGHWRSDRALCFDGRTDRQLKVRGSRVEPGEIEQAAAAVAGVATAAVVPLRRDGIVDAVALFYTSPRSQVTEAALRAELSGTLPGYLVPRLIRRIDRFPLLSNGKLDYLMLEMIISAGEPGAQPPQGPRGAAETTVAGIFAEVLGVSPVPREASLFDLSGDSLAVARISARLERATGKKVHVSQVFRTPTVAGLAAWLEAEPDPVRETDRTAARATGRLVALPPMQALLLPSPQVNDLAWWIDGPVDVDALARAATDVHRRHQALHARYISSGPDEGHALLPADPGEVRLHRLPEAGTDAEAIDALRAVVSQPVIVDEGEIWRCALVPSAASGRLLLGVGVHHAALDGWAAGILAADLSAAYRARLAGAEPEFGAPVAELADFEADYRRQLAGTSLEVQHQFWLSELANLPACHLPGRIAGVESFIGPAAAPAFAVEPAALRPWEAYGRSNGMPPFVWTAAACTEALIRAGAPRDFCFMVPVAKRGNDLLDRSIACRMGSVCLRPNAPAAAAPGLLSRTQDAYVRAMAAQDLFLDFREVENVIGKWAETPAMPAMPVLLYQDNPAPVLRLGAAIGVEEEAIGGWETSVVDLCLELHPATPGKFLRVAIRSDLYPADLANSIGRYFQEIIGAGPACLDG